MCDRGHRSLGSYPDNELTAPVPFARFSMICCTRFVARSLGAVSQCLGKAGSEHLDTAGCGEMKAYFYLTKPRSCVAKNFRTPHEHGETDMIGWDDGVLLLHRGKDAHQVTLVPPEMAERGEEEAHPVGRAALPKTATERSNPAIPAQKWLTRARARLCTL
jgi:hypothetical protein